MANEPGRPEYTKETYESWLIEMKPFLERGKSLYKSMELSGLLNHQTTIYEKYRLKDWFSQKVDAYSKVLGEVINDGVVSLIYQITDKIKRGDKIDELETKQLLFAAEKHRAAQPFFVNRFETAKGKSVEEIIENLETQNDNIDDVAENIEAITAGNNEQQSIPAPTAEQMVADNTSLQNQGQTGPDSNIPPQPDPNAPPTGNPQ